MKDNNEESKMKGHERMKICNDKIRRHHEMMRKHSERVIVKGYMRPDGTSYYVVIPKQVREKFGLKGGEYFLIKAKPIKNEITLKLAKIVEEQE